MIEILTPQDIGGLLQLPANKIILLAREGELPFIMIDGKMRFDAADVEDWLVAKKVGRRPASVRDVSPGKEQHRLAISSGAANPAG